MTLVRFNHAGYPVTKSLVDELYRNFGFNDTREDYCACVPSNVIENEQDFRLELSVPGFSKDEVKISVQKNILIVKSEKSTDDQESIRYLRRGFVPRNFEKRFELSKHIDTEQISASFNNGILEIVLPKREEVLEKAPVEIQIQ
ncbi:MAG: Hsp20/alpha crystallin family protein [Bacteroidota bacterium]